MSETSDTEPNIDSYKFQLSVGDQMCIRKQVCFQFVFTLFHAVVPLDLNNSLKNKVWSSNFGLVTDQI